MIETNAQNAVVVFRTDDAAKELLNSEIERGRLRQGWGYEGMHLMQDDVTVPFDTWSSRYKQVARTLWGEEHTEDQILRRYRILSIMTEFKEGDLIVVPKMPDYNHFLIATVAGGYGFDHAHRNDDFGHYVTIDTARLKRVPYKCGLESRYVVSKLGGYRRALNRVRDSKFIEFIEKLRGLSRYTEESILDTSRRMKDDMVEQYLEKLRDMRHDDLEKIVEHTFLSADYKLVDRHMYDGVGGDADLIFEHRPALPLLQSFSEHTLTVFVQIKQKTGIDAQAHEGIEQLAKISSGLTQCVRVLISTADEFDSETEELAEREDVQLISGLSTAEILMDNI